MIVNRLALGALCVAVGCSSDAETGDTAPDDETPCAIEGADHLVLFEVEAGDWEPSEHFWDAPPSGPAFTQQVGEAAGENVLDLAAGDVIGVEVELADPLIAGEIPAEAISLSVIAGTRLAANTFFEPQTGVTTTGEANGTLGAGASSANFIYSGGGAGIWHVAVRADTPEGGETWSRVCMSVTVPDSDALGNAFDESVAWTLNEVAWVYAVEGDATGTEAPVDF